MYILDACTSNLASCCNSPSLATLLVILKKGLSILQFIAPILLIIALTIGFSKMAINPEDKKTLSKIKNPIIACVVLYFIPLISTFTLSTLSNTSLNIGACWKSAVNNSENINSSKWTYQSIETENKTNVFSTTEYDEADPMTYEDSSVKASSASGVSAGIGSAKGKEIVNYALKFVGNRYVWGGYWNGEMPYTGTDCSGFVSGVYHHFGFNVPLRSTTYTLLNTGAFVEVSAPPQAGDMILTSTHVVMATGNGDQIVHAAGRTKGIIVSSSYKYMSGYKIYRLKGV